MPANINRRRLKFHSLDQLLGDAVMLQRLGYDRLGTWSLGQVCDHLAATMDCSIDGFGFKAPLPIRMIAPLFKPRLMDPDRGFPAGVKFPAKAAPMLEPNALSDGQGIARLDIAIARLRSDERRVPSPLLGPLTGAEWDILHCNHAALHLSFLVPKVPVDSGSNVTKAEFDSAELRR